MRADVELKQASEQRLTAATERVEQWFGVRGWRPFDFQRQTWDAYLRGRSGLLHAPTGMGKTQAVWLGPVIEALAERATDEAGRDSETGQRTEAQQRAAAKRMRDAAEPIRVLWLTPLRALATDTAAAITEPAVELGLNWSIELRTGDTSGTLRKKQRAKLPTALVTTPESLSLLLSYADTSAQFSTLTAVVVDEWHELIGTKRGVQTELCLARLRQVAPRLRVWGLSATIGNLEEARDVLLGASPREQGVMIRGDACKRIELDTLLPEDATRFPWSGHLGVTLLEPVVEAIERANTSLVFTNTRSQAEIWFQSINKARPDWLGTVALHHGSLDRAVRERVEQMIRDKAVRCVVCTSSLDLGVDFSPVDQVLQIGSPKGVARMMQRAGRSGHRPGVTSKVVCVPTHAMELVEFASARDAIDAGEVESRLPLVKPLDVLAQHAVTLAAGDGFDADQLLAEVRTSWAYRDLSEQEWGWVLDFVERGGPALSAYPQYKRVVRSEGRRVIASPKVAQLHRMSVGTITSEPAMIVRYRNGRTLGTIEESFISRLTPGDAFVFAGKRLELVDVQDMSAFVRPTKRTRGMVPRWYGTRMPLSTQLSAAIRRRFEGATRGVFDTPEMVVAQPLLELQAAWSHLPTPGEMLIESQVTHDGHHLFVFPFEGRLVHEGLGALLAYRFAQLRPRSITVTCNDYGFELLCPTELDADEATWRELLAPEGLVDDLLACMNAGQMARRQFRQIARVAGLLFEGMPGRRKTMRHLQASSDLFYDVFADFDPQNMLLTQAKREVLEEQLEISRLRDALDRISTWALVMRRPTELTPLAFPLWAESIRQQHLSTEKWADRVKRMAEQLEQVASGGAAAAQEPTESKASRARKARGVRSSTSGTKAKTKKQQKQAGKASPSPRAGRRSSRAG